MASSALKKIVRGSSSFPPSKMEIKAYQSKYMKEEPQIFEEIDIQSINVQSTCKKIGQGSYGEVFQHSEDSVIKKIDKYDASGPFHLEFTSVCELSILSKNRWQNVPSLQNVNMSFDGKREKYCVQMQHGGITLLQFSRQLNYRQRVNVLPWIGYQLVKAALALRSNGIIHTDIKSANVLVNDDLSVNIIDFGICSFETLGQVNKNYMSEKAVSISKDWGTYCICPPEAFIQNIWSSDKLMTWSIGITLCEFLFSTHSFIYDCVLNSTEKRYYKMFYKKDDVIKNVFSTLFTNKLNKSEKYLTGFHTYTDLPIKVIDLLQKMMTLKYQNRLSLQELILHDCFKNYCCAEDVLFATQPIPEFMVNHIDAPLLDNSINIDKFKYFRGVIVQWMFDFYDMTKKMQLFVHAVNIFDKYISMKHVPLKDYVKLATTCVYVAQYIHKRDVLRFSAILTASNQLVRTLLHKNDLKEPYVDWQDVVRMSDDILTSFEYDVYRQTFDVLLVKSGISVDMTVVANVLINNTGAYDNELLINKYMKMKY
jgi:serine/threonine protein kinase